MYNSLTIKLTEISSTKFPRNSLTNHINYFIFINSLTNNSFNDFKKINS